MARLKLLTKREVDVAKARDKQNEIEEGKKLAKAVDTLRELKAKEDTGLSKWRTETLATYQKEIEEKHTERDALLDELEQVKKRTALAQTHIYSQRKELDEYRDSLDVRETALTEEKKNVQRSISLNIERERANEEERKYLEVRIREVEIAHAEAQNARADAEKILHDARDTAQTIVATAEVRNMNSQRREAVIENMAQELSIQTQLLKQKEDALEERELKVIIKEFQLNSPVKK